MQDNARPHVAAFTVEEFHRRDLIYIDDWPASSPDLNPIEHVWALLKERIAKRQPRPYTKAAMHTAIEEEWDRLELRDWAPFIDSMPRRIQAVIDAKGGPTRY